jgi:nucleoside-diphosphate-sugar epimerase
LLVFPPRRTPEVEALYPRKVGAALEAMARGRCRRVVFTGSTSVYANVNRVVREDEPLAPGPGSGRAIAAVEQMLRDTCPGGATVLRVAGLIGPGRYPGNFLAGKRDVPDGDAPVNLVHRDDVVGIVREVIGQDAWGEVFNVAADAHPTRRDYYTAAAGALGMPVPTFLPPGDCAWKVVDNARVKERLGYAFRWPDPAAPELLRGEADTSL